VSSRADLAMTPSDNPALNLLLVEDDRVDQMAFGRMIREQSPRYTVTIAGSIAEARSVIGNARVDIAVCDFYLGDGTAFDILPEFVRSGIPVIVVSGAEDEGSATDAVRKGAVEYIVKDQNYNYLKALPLAIERALGQPVANPVDPGGTATAPAAASPGMPNLPSESDEVHFRRFVVDPSELIARYRPDGTILFVNDAYCRFLKKSRSDLIGQRSEPFLSAEDQARLAHLRSRLHADKPASVSEFRVHLPGGEASCWIRRTDRALFDEQGRIIEFQMVATDITEQKLAEEALRESEERYRMLAEHAFDGILVQDLEGTILDVNQSILRMFGFQHPEDIIGKNSLAFLASESQEVAVQDLRNVANGWQGYVRKYNATTSDGKEIIVESVGTLIPYQGKTANIVALRDVTERELATLQLQKELARKRDFINVAAHELRTPLQPVIGYLDLLMDESAGFSVPGDIIKILDKIHTNVEAERHMVNQILELSLLESIHEKMYWPEMSPVVIRELVELVIHQGRYAADAEVVPEIPVGLSLTSNGPYIHEILDALLANAVNYSKPPRSITVRAEEGVGEIRISVTDNGVGIPPEKQDLIFDPFFISDADKLSRKYGRLGVGLTMARARATRLGGTLTVKSVPGSGSTFTLSLPRGSDDSPDPG
jgi:PAS domain S-box-containing protein